MDLFTDTQKLVSQSGLSFAQIAAGAKIGERWLRRYMANDYKDVGVRRLQKLRNFLLNQKQIAA